MDYEKKYKNALEWARKVMQGKVGFVLDEVLEKFPELKDSEDERIRKKIIQLVNDAMATNAPYKKEMLAWVEKQGSITKLSDEEQNKFAKGVLTSCALSFIDYLDAHKYEDKMCVSNGECEDIENAFHNAMWDRLHRYYCKYIEKQGEQKPADKIEQKPQRMVSAEAKETMYDKPNWSEEDEMMLEGTIDKISDLGTGEMCKEWLKSLKDRVQPKQEWSKEDETALGDALWCCKQAASIAKDENDMGNIWYAEKWLKSLKPQNRWKPSDEQMEALGSATENCVYSEHQDCLREIDKTIKETKMIKL